MAEVKVDHKLVQEIMQGAIDTHVHTAPDLVPRKGDDIELATWAAEAGMAGYVSKNHQAPTSGQASAATKAVGRVRVYGSIALNVAVGGINPDAVRMALGTGARTVWLPTVSSEHHHYLAATSERAAGVGGGTIAGPVKIVDEFGRLIPSLYQIFDLVKQSGALLETGHLSIPEIKQVATEARQRGLEKIAITHPESILVGMPLDDQVELARLGCFMAHCYNVIGESCTMAEMAHNIRTVGFARCLMATDFGQAKNPWPVEGLRSFITGLLGEGFRPAEITKMVKENPTELLAG
jgi:hypothetical protein